MNLNVPKDLQGNIEYRAKLLKCCETDEILKAEVIELCSQSSLFWISCFCWTKDPRRKPNDVLPFIPYDFQERHILDIEAAINNQEDLLTDKSRDMGVTWDILYVFTHKWRFESGSDFRVGSRKEEFVDKLGDIDTLIEKVRFNLRRQPLWLMPKGFNYDDHAGFMRILNPENGNAIIGESANEYFGSGGRRKAILLDEFAKWENRVAESAWTATADVTKCRLPVSTPVGASNKFALLANGTKEKIKKTTLHWTLHPVKAQEAYYLDGTTKIPIESPQRAFELWRKGIRVRSPWYDYEAERRKAEDLAQEVDIDYLKSGRPFFNLKALFNQKEWQPIQRRLPTDEIPYGCYITANLIEVDNKIEIRENPNGWLRIYELPKQEFQYVVGGDASEGLVKGDEAFGVVREKFTRSVVADYNGAYAPEDIAIKHYKVAKLYNKAKVAPENNNHGYTVCSDLKEMDCDLYYTKHVTKKGEETDVKPGFTTTTVTRPEMLDQLSEEVEKEAIELRSPIIIAQCKTFVHNATTGKEEADGEFLDDGVIATAIAGLIIKELPFKPKKQEEHKAKQQKAIDDLRQAQIPRFK